MARGFTFKTVGLPEFNQLTATRQAFEKDRTQSIKNVMKDVSSAVIERRIAKKYDDPQSLEAMRERQTAYAGIDPARSEQARKLVNDAMTQQRLNLDQAYKQRAEKRAVQSAANTEAYRKEGRALEKERLKLTEEGAVIDDFTRAINAFDGDINLAIKTYPKLYKKFQELTQNNQTMSEEGNKTQEVNTISSEEIKNTENIIKKLEETLQTLSKTRQNKRKRSQLTKELMQQKRNLINLKENPSEQRAEVTGGSLTKLLQTRGS
jgi:hypothetical protein